MFQLIHMIVTGETITKLTSRKDLAPAESSKQGVVSAITTFGVFFRHKILQPSFFDRIV